jgi:hypothetical protein
MIKTTKFHLAQALFATQAHVVQIGNIAFAQVNVIARESGSGHTFNVTGYNTIGQLVTVYVQTID